jgi:HTH-type transcriptional regulator, sugar sensing transcriptional regulator
MQNNVIPILKTLGLLESEIKTYIATLELGPSTVLDISDKTDLSRQAIYTAIESLVKQGLMSSVEKNKKTLYAAESPERLKSFAQTKLKKMEAIINEVNLISDDLKLVEKGDKPIVKMFEGKEGIISIHDDIAQTKPQFIDDFVNDDALSKLLNEEDVAPLKHRLDKLNINTKALTISSETPSDIHRKLKTIKHIKRKDINFDGDIVIYGDKVALTSLQGKIISVIIDNPSIAQSLRELFKLAWENKELNRPLSYLDQS